MKKNLLLSVILFIMTTGLIGQNTTDLNNTLLSKSHSWEVKYALEAESLFPMFITGGYHFALGYRYNKFRLRASIINGGKYNAESAGFNNSSSEFKRYYKTSPGLFFGYNMWRNLEVYAFTEFHTFSIEQKSTGRRQNIHTTDVGGGVGYQFFIGKYFYIQPALHIYLRKDHSLDFNGATYNIPNADFSSVVRIGVRYWSK